MFIEGANNSQLADVTDEHQVMVRSESHALQHHASHINKQAYQVIGDFLAINNDTFNLLQICNDNASKDMVITYIRVQALDLAGGTALPAKETYFQLGFNTEYTSGGTEVIPININRGSGNTSDVTCYDNNPTVTGTFLEADRWYVESDGKMMTFNKEGAVIIPPGKTFNIRITSDHTSGIAYARCSFVMRAAGA
jgi:hypothetical protein